MASRKVSTPILPGKYYHIYNRGNNHERVFFNDEDYKIFLSKYKEYLEPYVDTFAYCLIPNHYHFLVRIKSKFPKESNASMRFKSLFVSYTSHMNCQYSHTGNVFHRYFKRLEVTDMKYLKRLIWYIHFNPVKHGLTDDFRSYINSSYKSLIQDDKEFVKGDDVMEWFGSKEAFVEFHEFFKDEWIERKLLMEE